MQLLHTMVRVADLDKAIAFYTEILGMKKLREHVNEEYKYTLVFVGYGEEKDGHGVIELTYNWGDHQYDVGTGFGHFGIAVKDVYATCDAIRAKGGKITREPGPLLGGTTHIAFVEDPDGYKVELIQRDLTAPEQA